VHERHWQAVWVLVKLSAFLDQVKAINASLKPFDKSHKITVVAKNVSSIIFYF